MPRMLAALLIGASTLANLSPALADGNRVCGPYRGLTRGPEVQAYAQLAFDDAFFNVCASTVDFDDASVEVDLAVGYNFRFSDQTNAVLKAIYHWYPDADVPPGGNDLDYLDLSASLLHRFDNAAVSGEIAYSPDFLLESGDAVFVKAGIAVPLIDNFIVDPLILGPLTASANIGHQWVEDNLEFGTPDYFTWDVGLTLGLEVVSVDLRYVDTDIDGAGCVAPVNNDFCDGGFLATFSVGIPGIGGVTLPSRRL